MKHLGRKIKPHLFNAIIIALAFGFFTSGCLILWAISLPIPDFQSFDNRVITQSTKLYDRTGKTLLYNAYKDIQRTHVAFEDISPNIKQATMAIEDDTFYQHYGIRPISIVRAVITGVGGGSTITQQLVKNSLLNQDRKISRKIKEMILAIKIERVKSKDEILTLYLNEIPYGGNLYGVEEAAQGFFHKKAQDVTLAEAAYLAAIPNAPTYFSPYGNHKDKLEARKNAVLNRMAQLKMISPEEATKAKNEKVVFEPIEGAGIKAPHFVFYIKDYLLEHYGQDVLENGGLKVITTIDLDLQQKAEAAITKFAASNEQKFKAKNEGLVAIDPKTGQILAMVGSRDYFETANDGNFNITLARRQPGSAFKPFVYAAAFVKGYQPETVLFDLETQFSTSCAPDDFKDQDGCYSPQNYDNKFRGPISLRDALAQSINLPAVKLLYLVGIKDAITTAKAMGISSLKDPNQYGLTLVLGGGEVSLLEMTSAYSVFANDGVRNPPVGILEVADAGGQVLEKFTPRQTNALPNQSARQISDILSNTAAPLNPNFIFPGRDVAAKTGTTNNYRDAWVIGYTPNLAVGTWAGNNDNTPMDKQVAGFIIAPIWGEFMKQALPTLADEKFIDPEPSPTDVKPSLRGFWQGGEAYTIDRITGAKSTENTPIDLQEERVITDVHSILYWVDRANPLGPKPARPESDPQFIRWEWPIQKWLQSGGMSQVSTTNTVVNSIADDIRKPEFIPKITITSPVKDSLIINESLDVRASFSVHFTPISQIDLFIDGKLISSFKNHTGRTLETKLSLKNLDSRSPSHELKIEVYDAYRNKGEAVIDFTAQ